MHDTLSLIFSELDAIAESAARLRARADTAGRQTDLEVSILARQLSDLQNKQKRATEFIDKSIGILTKLQNTDNHTKPENKQSEISGDDDIFHDWTTGEKI